MEREGGKGETSSRTAALSSLELLARLDMQSSVKSPQSHCFE